MRALVGACVGVATASGLWMIVTGLRGRARPSRPAVARPLHPAARTMLVRRTAVAVAVGGVVAVVTAWPAFGIVVAMMVASVPSLYGLTQQRQQMNARSDALASWAEMLRDTLRSHTGLREAIAVSARVAPAPIRADVQALATESELAPVGEVLPVFAARVGDPVADLVVAALVAADRKAADLPTLLTEIARTAREQTAMRLRVETSRARTYATARSMLVLTGVLAVMLAMISPTFMAPFHTAVGQVVLVVIGGFFAGAVVGLVRLGRPAPPPRPLVGIEARLMERAR